MVYHRDFLEMIKEQWLCNVRFTTVRADIDLSEVTVNSGTGDFNPTSLAHVINTSTVNKLVVQTWLDKAATRKSTLIFCVNLDHVNQLTAAFRYAGIDARYVYGGTPAAERAALIQGFRSGDFPVLLNCAVLTEGADIPNIDCVIVARPTRSRNVFAQMIGRGMRLSPSTGKEDCRIIDFVDSAGRVAGVVSTPTLFGLDPSEIVDDASLMSLEERVKPNAVMEDDDFNITNIPDPKYVTYIDYDDPFSLVDQSSGAPHIYKLSSYSWVGCGDDIYVLECMGKGFIRIEFVKATKSQEAHWQAAFTPPTLPFATAQALKISPFQRSRKVLTASSLADAVRGCDTYAKTKAVPGPMALGLLRSAKWRRQPATDNQKAFLRKRLTKRWSPIDPNGASSSSGKSEAERIDTMTKGEAANIITRLKHGAQARYEKKAKELRKVTLSAQKEKDRKAKEDVSVGPLPAM